MIWRGLILAACAALTLGAASAQPVNTGNVEGQLHSARAAVAPGETFTVILRQNIREGWHTYWRNPGDSGEPTELTWTNPQGFSFGPLQWPAPEAVPFAGIVNYGYHGEVLMPISVTAPADAPVGRTLTFNAGVYWLVCADICIPEEGTLTLSLPIAAQGRDDPAWAPRAAAAIAALPKREPGVEARITAGSPARLSVTLPAMGEIRNPHVFTFNRDVMAHSEPQSPRVGDAGFSFTIPAGVARDLGQVPFEGVVTYEANENGNWAPRAFEVNAAPGQMLAGTDDRPATISADYALAEIEGAAAPAAPVGAPMSIGALLGALALAFLAGLILNIMPCVLPVLSIKALSFAHGAQMGQARRHGALYAAGVLTTFLALAALLIALRAGGEALGWGFQLQAPWMISALALLFFVIGLNLLSVFEFGAGLQNAGAGLAGRGGDAGAFFTGALAVVAATPCTAPFMAGAIGAVLTQSAPVTLLIFAFLAIGFALPLTALHFAPALQKLIPRPGPWMERVKNVLAFPMFATAIWLVWVLAQQTGAAGAAALLLTALAVAFAIYVSRWGRAWTAAGVLILVGVAFLNWRPLVGAEQTAHLTAEPWSVERVAALQNEGRGVFVNFTAAWCVTCKANEAAALSSPRVAQAFADADVAYLKADWTNRDETIAAELARHGTVGVPLYLYYPPGEVEPIVLRIGIVLDEATVIDTIKGEAS
jgi:thiol:disulfide interchange protein/DsbC/DsbD-like thiol-disulfide interchange protein